MTLQDAANTTFIALTLYREARGETSLAKLAVAFTVMERVHRPSWWGHDVQSVLFKRWQYSSLTAPHDPQLAVWPANQNEVAWLDCLTAASQAYNKSVTNPAPDADSYFDDSITAPAWATPDKFIVQIGRLRFYDVDKDYESQGG